MNQVISGVVMKRLLGAALLVGLSACSSAPTVTTSPVGEDRTLQALERSAGDVSQSIRALAEVEQYDRFKKLPGPTAYAQVKDMAQLVTMPWDGPIESAARTLTGYAGYEFKVAGRSPIIPILVRIGPAPATISDHLRGIGMQAGSRADLFVYPQQRIVELRYSDAGV